MVKVYAVTIDGEVEELIKDKETGYWVDKSGKLDLCFDSDDGGLPITKLYKWIRLCYDSRSVGEALAVLHWVKSNLKESLHWCFNGEA